MKKLGSILCDGGEKKDYRRNIYLIKGRLICDGNDITPFSGKYRGGRAAGIEDAVRDVEALYRCSVWELELV